MEGIIKVIDYDGGGICFNITPSFDIDCDGVLYKHISIVDIEYTPYPLIEDRGY